MSPILILNAGSFPVMVYTDIWEPRAHFTLREMNLKKIAMLIEDDAARVREREIIKFSLKRTRKQAGALNFLLFLYVGPGIVLCSWRVR